MIIIVDLFSRGIVRHCVFAGFKDKTDLDRYCIRSAYENARGLIIEIDRAACVVKFTPRAFMMGPTINTTGGMTDYWNRSWLQKTTDHLFLHLICRASSARCWRLGVWISIPKCMTVCMFEINLGITRTFLPHLLLVTLHACCFQ